MKKINFIYFPNKTEKIRKTIANGENNIMNQNYRVFCDTLFIFKKFKALKLILRVFEIVFDTFSKEEQESFKIKF